MKKIIYSLVIMIAAGSLFTSCVENTEPQGIKELRGAKADYLAALSNLRAADAEKVKAEAALQQAYADVQKAIAAQNQATAEALKLKNEAQKVQDEVAAEKAKAAIDSIKAAAEQAAVKAEQDLAQAQWDLEVALRRIVAESFTLTAAEDSIIKRTADSLLVAQNAYNKEVKKLNKLNQRLWEAEYDHAAGCDSITDKVYPSKNYQDSVADRENVIAKKQADIANLEEVKAAPAKAKDMVDAYKATVKELQEDSLAAVTSKSLYDATTLVEADKAYAEKVAAFKKDSVGKKPAYCFTKDATKKTAVKYPLTNGEGLDARFGLYLNTIKYGNKAAGKTAAQYGIKVNGKNIEVGGSTVTNDKYLDSALVIVDEIVEALNRDLVVVNDSTEAKDYEDLVKAAKIADSTYKAHRAILEAGLKQYEPYKLAKDTAKMYGDTVNAAKTARTAAATQLATDTATVKTAIKTAAAAYIKANKDFATAVNNVQLHRGSLHGADSAEFVAATVALGKAQAAYFGEEDSLPMKKLNLQTGSFDDIKLPFSGLTAAGFVVKDTATMSPVTGKVTSLYGGDGYGEYANVPAYQSLAYYTPEANDPFSRVARIALNNSGYRWTPIQEKDVEYFHSSYYNSERVIAYTLEHLSAAARKDTVQWLRFVDVTKATAVADAYATLADDKDAYDDADDAVTAAEGKLTAKQLAVTKAVDKYKAIYNSFNGNHVATAIPTDDSISVFKWSDKTFSEPENCIEFGTIPGFAAGIIDGKGIIENNELVIALDGVDGPGYVAGSKYINSCKIFKGDSCATEFATAIYKAQLRDEKANYEFLEDQLANINEQFEAIYADVAEYNSEYADAKKGYDEGIKALTGGKEADEVAALTAAVVDTAKGVWKLKGKQLEFANEVAPEYPELVKATVSGNAEIAGRIKDINVICDTLDSVIAQWAKFEDPTNMGGVTTIKDVIDKLDGLIGDLEDEIADAEKDIVVFEKAIAMAEQGYDEYTIEVTALKQQIANAEEAVARAEAILKIRKAEYEAVIAQYGVNE